ncbi:MAG: hypothetical protein Q4G61_08410 [Tissierellia bacterium]|nr:hypothetical protein [Tissierellia bacterium]
MHVQRVGEAESPAERSVLNGPLRAQSKGDEPEYSATLQLR